VFASKPARKTIVNGLTSAICNIVEQTFHEPFWKRTPERAQELRVPELAGEGTSN
jgi:uncharacterized membrane protein